MLNTDRVLGPVLLKDIDPAAFNPPSRITTTALRVLRESMDVHGQLSPVHVVKKGPRYVQIDGHRRREVAQALGRESLDAIIYPEGTDSVVLWAELNAKSRTVTAFEWMHAWWLSGREMRGIPAGPWNSIVRCLKVFGGRAKSETSIKFGFELLIAQTVPPTMIGTVDALHARFAFYGFDTDAMMVARWMIKKRTWWQTKRLLEVSNTKKTVHKIHTKMTRDEGFELKDILPNSKGKD